MMIKLENVSLSFDEKTILNNFSFTFPDKGLVLIKGVSGSGKSSLAKIILGIIKADSGSVEISTDKFSVVFQEDRLVPSLTAIQNVELVSNKLDATKRLEQLKLGDSLSKYPCELSGGMKRRVAIARALAFGGEVLVLDEAFTGIEDDLAREIIGNICDEYKNRLVIAITHRSEIFSSVDHTVCNI